MDIIQIHPYPERLRKRARITTKRPYCDSFGIASKKQSSLMTYRDTLNNQRNVRQSILGGIYGEKHRSTQFVTEDSYQYISQEQQKGATFGRYRIDVRGSVDSVQLRHVQEFNMGDSLYIGLSNHFLSLRHQVLSLRQARSWDMSPVRMWQMSMACAMVFGMVTISMIYQNMGQSAYASEGNNNDVFAKDTVTAVVEAQNPTPSQLPIQDKIYSQTELVEIEEKESVRIARELQQAAQLQKKQEQVRKKQEQFVLATEQKIAQEKEAQDASDAEQDRFEVAAREMVAGYPIEEMLPEIFKLDREVATYLIAMAKQESQWGKRKPVLDGADCFNYWGFRSKRVRMGSGGHTCFDSRQDAVETVGRRVHQLVYEYERKTPESMLVWKCGKSCDGHSPEGVKAWVSTVSRYRDALKS